MNAVLIKSLCTSYKRIGILDNFFPKATEKKYRKESSRVIDKFFFTALTKLKLELLLECGAHEASASIKAQKLGLKAIAIEANPITFTEKTSQSKKYGVDAVNIGLGSEEGNLVFYTPTENPGAGNATFQKRLDVEYEEIAVQVTTIDSILKDKDCTNNKIALWVDVEGFSRDVLKGAEGLLKNDKCQLIKIEVETYPYFAGQALATEIDDYLAGFGFVAIIADAEYKEQFNLIYIKKDCLDAISEDLRHAWMELNNIRFSIVDFLKYFSVKVSKLFRVSR